MLENHEGDTLAGIVVVASENCLIFPQILKNNDKAIHMNRAYFSLLPAFFVMMLLGCSRSGDSETAESRPPNIIYILADDLGYGELGCYGQELIETPNIDRLAREGMQFTQHYTGAPVCAPARCILLTGQHSGHAHIRGNDEWAARGEVWDYRAMFRDSILEGQRPIPDSIVTVAELLQGAGYRTAAVGKWGLGAPATEGLPNLQGFDFFFGYNCQRQAHTLYPLHLWRNDRRVFLRNDTVPPNTKLPPGADPEDPDSYSMFELTDYAPELMLDEALQWMDADGDRPFFLYFASPLPHLPLQAPRRWVDHYREKLGPEPPYTGDKGYFPTPYPRATYAAMISYLDEQVGALLDKVREMGLADNTLVIFSSDNGPTYTGGADTEFFDSARPFRTDYGWGKGYVREGGIRVPMVARWPGVVPPASTSDHPSIFYDVLPTLCEVAGIDPPASTDGISFLPALQGRPAEQPKHEFLYWEFPEYNGQQAVRMGPWKAVRMDLKKDESAPIQLYNLQNDPREEQDVAAEHPDIVEKARTIMVREHRPATIERFRMAALGDNLE